MKKLARNLTFLLRQHKLSASKLARQTGVQQPVVHRIASGDTTNPKIETLLPIAQHFGVLVEQLIGTKPLTLNLPKVTTLPIFNAQQVMQHIRLDHVIACSHYITTELSTTSRAFAYIAHDNTMAPVFPQNTALIFDPEAPCNDQNFVLAYHQKTLVFRQLIKDGETCHLKPINADFSITSLSDGDQILAPLLQAKLTYLKEELDPIKEPTAVSAHRETLPIVET